MMVGVGNGAGRVDVLWEEEMEVNLVPKLLGGSEDGRDMDVVHVLYWLPLVEDGWQRRL